MGYYQQLAQCEGKVPFRTYQMADRVAKRRNRNGIRGKPYKCPHCGEYHIGSSRHSRRYHE